MKKYLDCDPLTSLSESCLTKLPCLRFEASSSHLWGEDLPWFIPSLDLTHVGALYNGSAFFSGVLDIFCYWNQSHVLWHKKSNIIGLQNSVIVKCYSFIKCFFHCYSAVLADLLDGTPVLYCWMLILTSGELTCTWWVREKPFLLRWAGMLC